MSKALPPPAGPNRPGAFGDDPVPVPPGAPSFPDRARIPGRPRWWIRYAVAALAVSLPFTVIHLVARPDDAPITPLQHVTAAVANFFGPWGGVVVRLVDFPNAGLRSFRWTLAVGLTVLGVSLLALAPRITDRRGQLVLTVVWTLFTLVWFGVGLGQIADGLL